MYSQPKYPTIYPHVSYNILFIVHDDKANLSKFDNLLKSRYFKNKTRVCMGKMERITVKLITMRRNRYAR